MFRDAQPCICGNIGSGSGSGQEANQLRWGDDRSAEGLAEREQVPVRSDNVFRFGSQHAAQERIVVEIAASLLAKCRRHTVQRLLANPTKERQRLAVREMGSLELQASILVFGFNVTRDARPHLAASHQCPGAPRRAARPKDGRNDRARIKDGPGHLRRCFRASVAISSKSSSLGSPVPPGCRSSSRTMVT